ncbi:serine/threonine-protein kinase PLK4-like [Macrosteles quadrilineatus]|uniref:serine/threonine-protein kinase PLK4-like n=1 Tax=Macrosteles quadrilineatus TaxID=74068 RepID=UPI0023E31F9C|nr:serine/threonine-protein kinase PLK4-like [Macrosteles quadrilineatus]
MSTSGLGQRIEDYDVLDLLGKGGFASVYRARCRKTFMEVAIKMIDKNLMFQKKMEKRVVEEVKIHSQLKHPSVLELYTRFEDKNYVYLVLELAHNGELHRYMKANNIVFTEEQAKEILKQVVDGLRYLHSHNIIHRDMTLSNLLLTKDHRVKIADFGLATKLAYPGETHKTMCGTPNYISPEIALRRTHGLETDVWGLGCVLFTLLVGRPPFDTRAIQITLERVINLDYHIPDYLSNEARDLIMRLLQEKPEDRIHLDQIPSHPFMNDTPSVPFYKQQSGHTVESGLGTTLATTGCTRQDTFSPHHSKHASIRSRSLDRRDTSKVTSGLRQKLQNILPLQGRSPMSPNFLPSRQQQAYFHGDQDRLETSTHSRKDRSMQELVRSGCSRHESSCSQQSQRSKQSCERMGGRSNCDEDRCESVKCSSHKYGKNDSCCGSSHSRARSQDGVDLDMKNIQCRTCGLASEGLYSQCLQCRRIDHVDDGCRNQECDCSRRSKCQCENERECLPANDRVREHREILHSVMNTERKFLPDLRLALPEPGGKSRTPRSRSSERLPPQDEEDEDAVNEFVGIKINKNEKRNLDHVPLNVPPLCSVRLKPARYKTSNFVVSILETGEVCLEKLKKRKNGKREKVVEVCRISSDGLRVLVYCPDSDRGVIVGDVPPPVPTTGADAVYSYHSLPTQYHRPYETAARFVRLHQAQTPKVTLHSSLASCFLMENSPNNDFHVKFYTGYKLLKADINKGVIKLLDPDGKTKDLDENDLGYLSPQLQKMWDHFQQMLEHCLLVEKVLEQISTHNSPCFPVTIGSKPAIHGVFKGKENASVPTPNQRLPLLGSYEVSEASVTSKASHANVRSHSRALDIKSVNHQVAVSGMSDTSTNSRHKPGAKDRTLDLPHLRAVATKKPGGELKIMYRDGTELAYNEPAGTIEYRDGSRTARYRTSDTHSLPDTVRHKLAQVPDILWHFLPADKRQRPRTIR